MRLFKKKTKKQILEEEILRFKKRVEKRLSGNSLYKSPFVQPFVDWDKEYDDEVKCTWNDVKVKLFFDTYE